MPSDKFQYKTQHHETMYYPEMELKISPLGPYEFRIRINGNCVWSTRRRLVKVTSERMLLEFGPVHTIRYDNKKFPSKA